MIARALFRFASAVLILAGQLAGAGAAMGPGSTVRSSKAYSCCCVGECHCTGDCCNHPPQRSPGDRRPGLDAADGWPEIRASRTCGASVGSLGHEPVHNRLSSPRRPHSLTPPADDEPPRLVLFHHASSSRVILARLAPRAPPVLHPAPVSA